MLGAHTYIQQLRTRPGAPGQGGTACSHPRCIHMQLSDILIVQAADGGGASAASSSKAVAGGGRALGGPVPSALPIHATHYYALLFALPPEVLAETTARGEQEACASEPCGGPAGIFCEVSS